MAYMILSTQYVFFFKLQVTVFIGNWLASTEILKLSR